MPTWANINARDFEDFLIAFNRYMDYFVSHLSSKNVKRLDTNETQIKSKDGTTYINGPVLEMRDATKRMRLEMGYDAVSGDFIFKLYDTDGDQTLHMDDAGQIRLVGRPLFTMYDDQGALRAVFGYDPVLQKFVFELRDPNEANMIYLDDNGEAVFAGNVITTKDIYVGNNIYMNATTYDGKGIYMTPDTWIKYVGFLGMSIESDKPIKVFTGDSLDFQAQNGINFVLYGGNLKLPTNSYLGTVMSQNKIATMDDVQDKINAAVDGYTGTFTTADGETVTIENGLITDVS